MVRKHLLLVVGQCVVCVFGNFYYDISSIYCSVVFKHEKRIASLVMLS